MAGIHVHRLFLITLIIIGITLLSVPSNAQNLDNLSKREPFKLSGNISSGTSFYGASGIENRKNPLSYYITAAPTISIYEFNLPFNFTYRDQQGSLSHPFQRFDFNPSYKWVKLGIGNTSLELSPYTFSGQYFKGVSVELTPKNWRFKGGYGNLENPLAQIDTIVEGTLILPTYKRKMLALSLGYGSGNKFIDLIFFRAKDNLDGPLNPAINRKLLSPEENEVLGLNFGFPISKYFSIKANTAGSIHTSNHEALEDIQSTKESGFMKFVKNVFDYNMSSKMQFAGDASLNFKQKYFGMGLEYKRVAPYYKSLGTYYFQEDFQNIVLKMNVNLFKNKIKFNGSGGIQKNNLNKLRESTRIRKIINSTIVVAPNQLFNVTLRVANFQSDRVPVLESINDTLKFTQTTETYGLIPVFFFKNEKRPSTLSLMANYQKLIDLGMGLQGGGSIDNYTGNIVYSMQIKALELSLNTSLLYNQNIIGATQNIRIGGSVGAEKKLFKKKVSASSSLGLTQNSINGYGDGVSFTGTVGIHYKIKKKLDVSLNTNILLRTSKIKSYQEYRGAFKVSYQFSTKSKKSK